jgi:hypothetical protein
MNLLNRCLVVFSVWVLSLIWIAASVAYIVYLGNEAEEQLKLLSAFILLCGCALLIVSSISAWLLLFQTTIILSKRKYVEIYLEKQPLS